MPRRAYHPPRAIVLWSPCIVRRRVIPADDGVVTRDYAWEWAVETPERETRKAEVPPAGKTRGL